MKHARLARSVSVGAMLACSGAASAQSLFRVTAPLPPQPAQTPGSAIVTGQPLPPNPVANLDGMSLYAVQPMPPRQIQANDLITIIVNQSSRIDREQTLETEKESKNGFEVNEFLDLGQLLDARLRVNTNPNLARMDINSKREFTGDGAQERRDTITARITAKVLDVKPNGQVVLEARSSIISDDEEQVMLISGVCRAEDITLTNTVQSTQLADLRLEIHHSGELREAAKKGVLTKLLDTIFNF